MRSGVAEWRKIDEEIVVLDVRTKLYLGVNPAGAALWELLEPGAAYDDLVDALVRRFRVSREHAIGDVDAFLAQLREQDLLEPDVA